MEKELKKIPLCELVAEVKRRAIVREFFTDPDTKVIIETSDHSRKTEVECPCAVMVILD